MKNINELIGIIRAIDFDGVINTREVDRLRNWVDYNRNLATRDNHIQLLKLVDDVIEDNVITKEEIESLFAFCDSIQREDIEDSVKLFELSGIVEGIICDGEVNEFEVYRLKRWFDDNSEFINYHGPSQELRMLITDVLEDDIITEDEQRILLQRLSEYINGSQFDMKLDYLKKKVRKKELIGLELIDLLDDENSMSIIHHQAENYVLAMMERYTKSTLDSEIVFISLVLIAMIYYDGNFYDNVRSTYKKLYSRYPRQSVESYLRNVMKKFTANSDLTKTENRNINVILRNAIVPASFLKPFFDFIYDIYKINFEYSLPKELYKEFEFVYEGLRKIMKFGGDEIKLDVTKKTYKLIRTTKDIIIDNNLVGAVIDLSIIVVKLIDKHVWNKEIKIYNPYFKNALLTWIKEYDSTSEGHNRRTGEMRSRWKPKYVLMEEKVCLLPPVHKIRTDRYYDLEIVVLNGDVEIYRNETPYIEEIMGGFKIKGEIIEIDNPIGNISYKLMQGDRIIYDSNEVLFRNFIVFDINGNEIKNNTEYKGTIVLACSQENEGFSTYVKHNKYVLATKNVEVGDICIINNSIFNFSSLLKAGVFGEQYRKYYLFDVLANKKIDVFKNVEYVAFESSEINAEYYLTIDNKRKSLEKYIYTTTYREGVVKYIVKLEINKPGIYKVLVDETNHKNKRILSYLFVLDPIIEANSVSLEDSIYAIAIKTALSDTIISRQITAENFDEEGIEFEYMQKKYKYGIPFNFAFYRITGQPWKSIQEGIWIDDVSQDSVLDICDTEVEDVMICPCGIPPITDVPKIKDKKIYKQIPINFLVSYKNEYDYTFIAFVVNGKVKKGIFCDNRCNLNINDTIIDYDPRMKSIMVMPHYNGKGNVFVKLFDAKGSEIYRSGIVEKYERIFFEKIESFKEYKIAFYEKKKGLGLGNKERLMYECIKMYCDADDFIGKIFNIAVVNYKRDGIQIKTCNPIRTIIRFNEKNNDGSYTAEIRQGSRIDITSLRNINPVKVRIVGEPNQKKLEIMVSHGGHDLHFYERENSIYNGIGNNHIPVISTIKIDL